MKALYALMAALLFGVIAYGQEGVEGEETTIETPKKENAVQDTTRMKFGNTQIIIVTEEPDETEDETDWDEPDSEGDEDEDGDDKWSEAHWAGIDFGFSVLMNSEFNNKFEANPYWKNDPAKSQVWNLNIFDHKFNFGTPYVGLTTGLGLSFTSVAFNENYVIQSTPDTLFAVMDTSNVFTRNKLKATYLTVPLLLEFNTSSDSDRNFYLAAGVVGGVRIASKVKRVAELEDSEFKEKIKGTYGLNPFKLDAAVRFGYANFGIFANYSLLPLFDTNKTVEVYPLTFGLSLNF